MTGDLRKARRGIRFALVFTAVLWTIKAFEFLGSTTFDSLGILPRTLTGSIGILTGPLIHGDVFHLMSNTFPLLVLTIGIFYFYHRIAPLVFFLIYFMTGFWVWVAARDAYHIGASGLVYGLISFMLFSGFIRRDVKTLAVSFAVLFIYGGNMVYGLIPGSEGVSWESHLLGALAGLFCAIYFKPKKMVESDEVPASFNTNFKQSGYYSTNIGEDLEYNYKEKKSKKNYYYTIGSEEENNPEN